MLLWQVFGSSYFLLSQYCNEATMYWLTIYIMMSCYGKWLMAFEMRLWRQHSLFTVGRMNVPSIRLTSNMHSCGLKQASGAPWPPSGCSQRCSPWRSCTWSSRGSTGSSQSTTTRWPRSCTTPGITSTDEKEEEAHSALKPGVRGTFWIKIHYFQKQVSIGKKWFLGLQIYSSVWNVHPKAFGKSYHTCIIILITSHFRNLRNCPPNKALWGGGEGLETLSAAPSSTSYVFVKNKQINKLLYRSCKSSEISWKRRENSRILICWN